MTESAEFLKRIVPQKSNIEEAQIKGAEVEKIIPKKSIMDDLIAEAKSENEIRKIPLMGHVDPDVYEKIVQLCKKTGRTKSRIVNDVLKRALSF